MDFKEKGLFEEIGVFYRGLVLGLMIAAPVGPIGILCIRRTIQKGIRIGFATGLGAACADTVFGTVAALGVAAIVDFMRHYDLTIRIVGGAILALVAWHTWHDQPRQPKDKHGHLPGKFKSMPTDNSLLAAFKALLSSFFITITNPLTMFGTLAVVAAFGHLGSGLDAGTLVAGIFTGSTLWWILLSGGITTVREHFTETRIIVINRVTALILAVLAFSAVGTGVAGFFKAVSA